MTTAAQNNPQRAKIQQLLAAIGSKTPDDSSKIEAVDYDWHQPHFFNSQQTRKLASFASRIATLIGERFSALCQHNCEVKITSTSEHFAGQFLGQDDPGQNQGPSNYYLPFATAQEPPCGFVSIPPQTALAWTTQLLGDTESKQDTTRALSDLEASLLFDMASLTVEAISKAGEKCNVSVAADAVTNRLPLQLKGSEEFCKITFQVKKGDAESSMESHILIMCEKLAPVVADTGHSKAALSEKDNTAAIQSHIEQIPVPLIAQLACVPLTVEQVLNLAEGDILLLDKKTDEPVYLQAAGQTLFNGRFAKVAGNYAVAVTHTAFEPKAKQN